MNANLPERFQLLAKACFAAVFGFILVAGASGSSFAADSSGIPAVKDEVAGAPTQPFVERATPIESAKIEPAAPPIEEAAKDDSKFAQIRALVGKSSLIPVFEKGGIIMWPLLFASILALGTVIDRFFFLISVGRTRDRKAMHDFFEAVAKNDIEEAIRIGKESRFYIVRTLGFALAHKEKSIANAILYAQEQEMKRFRRGIPILDTIITLAPLLGLLGTVTGMMGSFALIGGELSTPGAVTSGIAEALIATSFGLGIAITSLIPFNFLNNKMENARIELDSAATQLELMMMPKGAKAAAKAPSKIAAKPARKPVLKPMRPRRPVEIEEEAEELVGSVFG